MAIHDDEPQLEQEEHEDEPDDAPVSGIATLSCIDVTVSPPRSRSSRLNVSSANSSRVEALGMMLPPSVDVGNDRQSTTSVVAATADHRPADLMVRRRHTPHFRQRGQ